MQGVLYYEGVSNLFMELADMTRYVGVLVLEFWGSVLNVQFPIAAACARKVYLQYNVRCKFLNTTVGRNSKLMCDSHAIALM